MAFRCSRFSLRSRRPRLAPLGLALAALAAQPAVAQQVAALQSVTVTGRAADNAAAITGFGDLPLGQAPWSATVLNARQLTDAGIASLGDLTRLDAAATDAYNAPGYWSQLAVRGFTLDNRFNYRRDGLPINAETVIAQANKQALEVLKGISGLQAGTSAPGGLVNLIVKRPTDRVRSASLAWEQDGTVATALDIGDRAGAQGWFGWRINAEQAKLDPTTQASRGHRRLLAAAAEAQFAPGSLLEAEVELSRQSQPSTPGFSLLGNRLPDADSIDPTTNLNNQAWSLPVVMNGRTGSLRYTQAIAPQWQLVAHAMSQHLSSDDRIAFPFGCSAEGAWDRYCSDGSFDLYDYRSEGEHRRSDALDLSLGGRARALGVEHAVNVGLLATRYQARFHRQAYNWVGAGRIDGLTMLPADPTLTTENTNRDERSTELHLQDAVTLDADWRLFAGLRHSELRRSSVSTDGSQAISYRQQLSTPWLALSRRLAAGTQAYASWGQGMESEVAPKLPRYANAGQALPALKSRQLELGLKQRSPTLDWSVAAFDIRRPVWSDLGTCDDSEASCERRPDGTARHRGLEAEAEWRGGPWSLRGSAMALHARREGAADASLNGLKPTNVPAFSLKAQAVYNVTALPGLALLGFVSHEGKRIVLPDNSIATPGWTRLDLGARYSVKTAAGPTLVWRAGIDNVADVRAWKEAPYQYGHAYLYPLAPRSLHASAQIDF